MTGLRDIENFVEMHQEICDEGHPATDELIEKAERYLDVRFPDDYRAFLKRWGTLSIGPLEFYGICKEDFVNSSVPDAIWYTQRKRQQLGLPKELVILSTTTVSSITAWTRVRLRIPALLLGTHVDRKPGPSKLSHSLNSC